MNKKWQLYEINEEEVEKFVKEIIEDEERKYKK